MSNRAERRRAQRQANRSGVRVRLGDGEVVAPEFVRGAITGKRRVPSLVPSSAEAPDGPGGAQPASGRRSPRGIRSPRRGGMALLDAISAAVSARAAAEEAVDQAVRQAREGGESWRAIGEVLGVSHPTAAKRYGGAV